MTAASAQVTVIDISMMIALTLSCISFLFSFDSVESSVRPVILIPGFTQSRLDAKITSDFKNDNLFCKLNAIDQSSEARYQYVFVDLKFVTSREAFLCLKDILTLDFDPRTSLAIEPIGASIIPRQFGNVIGTFGVNDILTLNDSSERIFHSLIRGELILFLNWQLHTSKTLSSCSYHKDTKPTWT